MSAFFAMAYPDRIELLTDGAVYEDDGTLVDIRRKVQVSDRLPMAVTGRGPMGIVHGVGVAMMLMANTADSVDDAIQRIDEMMQRRSDKGTPADFEMAVVGISEANGPVILYVSSIDMYGAGIQPWRLHTAGGELGGGPRVDVSGLDPSEGLRSCGVELLERMRRVPGMNPAKPDLPYLFGIGGHIDLTTVRADGCTVERLHIWPEDVIGEKIRPDGEIACAA